MKLRFALASLLLAVCVAGAATLRPSMIVYGIIRDSYGLRLGPDSATVSGFLGTNEVARTAIKQQPLGANYRFDVDVSDPLTAGNTHVVPGSIVTVRVRVGTVFPALIGTNSFIAQGNGAVLNLNLVLGVDSDNDGIPDDWEWLAIQNSNGQISNLSQIGPGLDLDGDGITDDKEFLAGTFPFLPDDQLRMAALTRHANGRLSFTFTPIEGLNYWVEFTPTIEDAQWTVCPISLSAEGALIAGTVTGGTQPITLFMEPGNPSRFWRLRGNQ